MAAVISILCWVLSGCGRSAEQLAVAKVGDIRITASQLRDFERRLPEDLKSRQTGLEGHLDHLQNLIDKEILLQEARKRHLESDPALRRQLAREREERILHTFLGRQLEGETEVEDEELQNYLVETGRDREVQVRKIVVKTRDEAEEIARLLSGGSDFAELAQRRSIHQPTARRGGEIKGYARKEDMIPLFQEKVFPLHRGEMTEPVELPDGNYAIFQVIDERAVELREMRGKLQNELVEKRYAAGVEKLAEKLQQELELRPHYEGLRLLAERAGQGASSLSETERDTVLYEFAGGKITLGAVADLARDLQINLAEGEPLWFAGKIAMPRALFLEEAHRAGIDAEEELVEWSRRQEQALLLLAIRRAVVSGVSADGGEARQYYGRHPEAFTAPDSSLGLGPAPFSRVERRARALVRLEKQDRLFDQFLMDLRRQYEPVIEIYTDNLQVLSQEGNL